MIDPQGISKEFSRSSQMWKLSPDIYPEALDWTERLFGHFGCKSGCINLVSVLQKMFSEFAWTERLCKNLEIVSFANFDNSAAV